MSSLVDEDSLEVKAIKLHLAAAKQKVLIAKEHAEWSNYQLDESKKHFKDVQKKLREAKRSGVDILDNAAADEDSKQEASSNIKRNDATVVSSSTSDDNQPADNTATFNNVLEEDDTISNEQPLKKCGSCGVEKKRWSYLKAEWDKLEGSERLCQVCTTSVDDKKKKAAVAKKSRSKNTSIGPKRIRRKCSAPNCNNRVVQGDVCVTHGAKRKLCSHPGCTNWPVRFASACSMHGPGRKNTQTAGELLIKNTDKSSSTGEKRDNKQEVLQHQPPVKKRKTTDISEGGKKAKQLSKSEYDKARRDAMKAGTWNPDPRYQPKPKPPPPQKKVKLAAAKSPKKLSKSAYDKARREAMKAGTWKPDLSKQPKRMRNGTHNTPAVGSSGSGNTGSRIEMLTKAAESDLLHSLFRSNSRVAKDDNNGMDEDTTKLEAKQIDVTQTRSGRKITPSSKKKGGYN